MLKLIFLYKVYETLYNSHKWESGYWNSTFFVFNVSAQKELILLKVKLIQAIFLSVVLIHAVVFLVSCDKGEKTIRRGEKSGISNERPLVQVLEKLVITKPENGRFYYPQFSQDDSLIYMTSDNFYGLWYYDL